MILLDTHVLLWLLLEPEKLSQEASAAITRTLRTGEAIAISPITLVEIARLAARGRVQLSRPARAFLGKIESDFSVHTITAEIAYIAGQLADPFPGDPADRIIAATALTEGMTLITADDRIRRSAAVKTIW
jgi:PIN domain nuclease of toxin-antitoxin system